MVSFHALQLFFIIKSHDQRETSRILISFCKFPPCSSYSICLLIRYILKLINSFFKKIPKIIIEFFNQSLKSTNTKIIIETIKAISYSKKIKKNLIINSIRKLSILIQSKLK